jgi:hypothetical protein
MQGKYQRDYTARLIQGISIPSTAVSQGTSGYSFHPINWMTTAAKIVMQASTEAVAAAESVTVTVKQNVPGWVGVPVTQPVEPPSVKPGGTEPAVIT